MALKLGRHLLYDKISILRQSHGDWTINEVVRSFFGHRLLNKMDIPTSNQKVGKLNISDGPETWQAPTS